MATPDIVQFARVRGVPAETYERLLEEFFRPLGLEEDSSQFTRLHPTNDPFYVGFAPDDEYVDCGTFDDLIELVKRHTLFGTVHLVPYIPGYIYPEVYSVDENEFSLTMAIDSSLVYWEDDRYERGQWFKMMLTTLTASLRSQVCGYGTGYPAEFRSLSPAEIVALLRSGDLLNTAYPSYHAISVDLISTGEVRKAMARREITPENRKLKHEVSVSGYHLLYIL
jgi:hypothetical protein